MNLTQRMQNLWFLFLLLFLINTGVASGQVQITPSDTVFVYETVIVYDTLVIHDTIRINKARDARQQIENPDSLNHFFEQQTATFSENDIISHENKNQKRSKDMIRSMKKLSFSALIVAAQSMVGLSAQEPETTGELKSFPIQMSVVYPMTTQGDQTINYCYNFSFNLFSGRVGAVTGLEFGSIFNRVEKNVKGVQLGGLANMTHDVTGLQFGGLGNASKKVNGVQLGGLANISGDVTGLQFGGLANISENTKGIQLSGLANITRDVTGFQFGGLVNLSEHNKGIQLGGITNVTGESKGFQFAGVANVSNEVSGASFGGVFNRTGKLRGFQFGIVNVTDTIEKGVSLAIINIVKKGFYDEWVLSFADYANVSLSYKMGIQRFYTIYSIGANFIEDKLWVVGIGFGNRTALGKRIDFQPEIISYNYYPEDFKNVRSTWATHLKIGFVYKLNEKLGILVAPSIYQLSTDLDSELNYYKVSSIKPFSSSTSGKSRNEYGVGISVGLILR